MQKHNSNKTDEKILIRGVIFVALGCFFAFIIPQLQLLPPYIALCDFCLGMGALCFGLIDVSSVFYRNRSVRHKILHPPRANNGVVWIWAVCLAGICLYAIAFYVLLYPTLEVLDIVEGLTTFDANASFTLNLCRTVLNWHPIIFIVGLLIWAFVNSQRREEVTYGY